MGKIVDLDEFRLPKNERKLKFIYTPEYTIVRVPPHFVKILVYTRLICTIMFMDMMEGGDMAVVVGAF